MTAIAYKGGLMAADTATFAGDVMPYHVKKIWRTPRGALVASAGDLSACMAFKDWVIAGQDVPFDVRGDDFHGIIVQQDGAVLHMYDSGGLIRVDAPFHVAGGAHEIMIGAMAAGATAPQAVEIAMKWSKYAGGGLQVESLEDRGLDAVIGGPGLLKVA